MVQKQVEKKGSQNVQNRGVVSRDNPVRGGQNVYMNGPRSWRVISALCYPYLRK